MLQRAGSSVFDLLASILSAKTRTVHNAEMPGRNTNTEFPVEHILSPRSPGVMISGFIGVASNEEIVVPGRP